MATLLITDLNFIRAVYQQLGISMMFWCLVILKKNLNPVFSFTEREACYLKVISNSSNHDIDSNSGLMLQRKRLDSQDSISSRLPAPPPSPLPSPPSSSPPYALALVKVRAFMGKWRYNKIEDFTLSTVANCISALVASELLSIVS